MSLLETRLWHLWTLLTTIRQPAGMLASTSRKSQNFCLGTILLCGTVFAGAVDCLTSSLVLSSLWTASSGGEPHALQLLLSPTLGMTSLANTVSSTVNGLTVNGRVTHSAGVTPRTRCSRRGSRHTLSRSTTLSNCLQDPTLGTSSLSCHGTDVVTVCTRTLTAK